jgi:hypothetical protein
MPRKAATALVAILCAACAPTWQANVRKGLSTAAVGAEQAVMSTETVCKQVLQGCIAAKENPCAALERCLLVRRSIIKAAVLAQLTALAGYVAVDAADQKKAEEALAEVVRLMDLIARGVADLR